MYLYYPRFFYSSLLHSCAPFCGSLQVKLLPEVADLKPLSDVKIERKRSNRVADPWFESGADFPFCRRFFIVRKAGQFYFAVEHSGLIHLQSGAISIWCGFSIVACRFIVRELGGFRLSFGRWGDFALVILHRSEGGRFLFWR